MINTSLTRINIFEYLYSLDLLTVYGNRWVDKKIDLSYPYVGQA